MLIHNLTKTTNIEQNCAPFRVQKTEPQNGRLRNQKNSTQGLNIKQMTDIRRSFKTFGIF